MGTLGSGPLWAFGGVLITAIVAWLTQSKKAEIDESALVMEQWKRLLDEVRRSGEEESSRLKTRVSALESEMAEMKLKYAESLAALTLKHAEERRSDGMIIEGLQRELSQVSQSTAVQIGRVKRRASSAATRAEEAESKIDNLIEDKNSAHSEINEHLARLDRAGDNSVPKGDGE